MSTPRITPVAPPYDPDTAEMLRKWMPPGAAVEPLRLFRTLCVHPELMARMRPLGAALLGHGLLPARDRELVILRTCARAGAEYEWGVHVSAFARAVGLDDAAIAATADPAPQDELLLRLADELHDHCRVSDDTWQALAARYSPPQLLELLVLAGWYRLLAGVIQGAAIEREPWAARLPATAAGSR